MFITNDPTVQAFIAYLRVQAARLRNEDKGALSIEAAIIVGALVLGAIGLGVFLAGKLTEKENAIK